MKRKVEKVNLIVSAEDVKELFDYRGGNLYWKDDIYYGNSNTIKIKAGTISGCVCKTKGDVLYRYVVYKKKHYKISRLIFLMFYGYLPQCVTYKDRNTLNTNIENLIDASRSEVLCIEKLAKNNSSSCRGVSFNKKQNKYRAFITNKSKKIALGSYNTLEEAHNKYVEAKLKYHGNFLSKCGKESYI